MKSNFHSWLVLLLLALPLTGTRAADPDPDATKYADTVKAFYEAGGSDEFFKKSYGYAVFPTIGKGGIGIGGAYGKGRVYKHGLYVGDSSMAQLSIGLQLGAQAYSMLIFFEDQRAFDEFTQGKFEFGAQATAVALTAGASASATTAGSSAGVSGGRNNAETTGAYTKGMAIFTITRGGLMYEAALAGMKFSYTPKANK